MEVYVLEKCHLRTGRSEVLGVFENADVGMNTVKDVIWTDHINFWKTTAGSNGIIFYLYKFEVVLDEILIEK